MFPCLFTAAALLLAATASAYETAPYTVISSDGPFEIRDYPSLDLAESPMTDDSAFGRLFAFISGKNAAGSKIAMTTPVFIDDDDSGRRMAFVMPREVGEAGVPRPTDASVRLRKTEPGRYAVFRFSGWRTRANEQKALEKLQAWMASKGHRAAGKPVFAYFDPPWVPGFWRRNEVMLPIGLAPR